MLISGCENIYPAEIENVIATHPGVVVGGHCRRARGAKEEPKQRPVPMRIILSLHCGSLVVAHRHPLPTDKSLSLWVSLLHLARRYSEGC